MRMFVGYFVRWVRNTINNIRPVYSLYRMGCRKLKTKNSFEAIQN